MEMVKTQLETQQFDGLTKDEVVGEMLYAAATSYFAANDANLAMLNRIGETLAYRHPSFGTFATNLVPIFSFGIPTQVNMTGLMVDMDVVQHSLWSKNNDAELSRQTVQQIGYSVSALEHQIPELFFTNEENLGEAVSAVKALAIASAQGQRIYQVTQENVDVVLPQLTVSNEVKREIRDAVTVGKEATVSQGNITTKSWTGVGYIITDPDAGAGAYRISGRNNGTVFWAGFNFGVFGLTTR